MPQRRRMARAIVSATAASTFLALGAPAWASNPVPLNDAHEGSTAAGFETQECEDERFDGLADDQDGWHFVLPGNRDQSGDFEKLELTFSDGTQTVDVVIPDAGDPYPDAFYSTGGKEPQVKHAYLFTPAGWTLVSGTAHVSGAADFFNLSHTCPGEPSATPSPSGSASPSPSGSVTPTPSTSSSPTPGDSVEPSTSVTPSGGTGGGDGGLPVTGAAATTMALLGVGLIGGGAALVMLRRRRDNVTFTS